MGFRVRAHTERERERERGADHARPAAAVYIMKLQSLNLVITSFLHTDIRSL